MNKLFKGQTKPIRERTGQTLRVRWTERAKSPLGRWDADIKLATGKHPARGRFQFHWSGSNLQLVFVTEANTVRYHTISLNDLANAFYQGLELRERHLLGPIVNETVIGHCYDEPITATLRRGSAAAGNLTVSTRVDGKTVSARIGCEDGCAFVVPHGSDQRQGFGSFNDALAAAKTLLTSGVEAHFEVVDRQTDYDEAVANLFDKGETP